MNAHRASLLVVVSMIALPSIVSCETMVTREIYLLPAGYEGPVAVVWNHPRGDDIERDDSGAVVYRLDQSGILRLRGERPSGRGGRIKGEYYYVDPGGVRSKVEFGGPYDYHGNSDSIEVYKAEVGVIGDPGQHRIHWFAFCVGVPKPGNACAASFDDWIRRIVDDARRF